MDLHELVRRFNLQAPRSCVLEREEEPAHQPSTSDDAAFRRDQTADTLRSTPASQTTNRRLRDPLDLGAGFLCSSRDCVNLRFPVVAFVHAL
nr:hypothetical protein CFP56_05478 [Quercus suber]